ncbi:hypothetical protein BGW36DRAFT_358086 [Talaromyces proteolyticus]|uniref:Lipocalin-like domain-containing protein n=1 Tax=Talaromyces proteolyticus TaxID=1131652 RepID=A0AAD4KR28_9EURO|nr:uncharacterized protein BGW36DRAFT_358086 [Talaromyces proteolyticus]KAH8698554.1 hypothetical protein BGW36DRAFT_358086 [Talaromyces proteolyticus]
MAPHFIIGLPKKYSSKGNKCVPPTNDFIIGTWHVTHSSLPLWKGKCNVNITYEILPADSSGVTRIDDIVKYQAIGSTKIKTVHGVDRPTPQNQGAWDWRGKGLLMFASSHWECLGFGHTDDGNQWIVTYFTKTLFTPAGIDIYSRNKDGLSQTTIDGILEALKNLENEEILEFANNIFQIPQN